MRLLPVALGCIGIAWAATIGAGLQRYVSLDDIATAVIKNENIPLGVLEQTSVMSDELERSDVCWPRALRSAAIVFGRRTQMALDSSEAEAFESLASRTDSSIRKSLRCSPSDPFMWFALFWIESLQSGLQKADVDYLRRSYELAPYEE
jgi:hypothetical protein